MYSPHISWVDYPYQSVQTLTGQDYMSFCIWVWVSWASWPGCLISCFTGHPPKEGLGQVVLPVYSLVCLWLHIQNIPGVPGKARHREAVLGWLCWTAQHDLHAGVSLCLPLWPSIPATSCLECSALEMWWFWWKRLHLGPEPLLRTWAQMVAPGPTFRVVHFSCALFPRGSRQKAAISLSETQITDNFPALLTRAILKQKEMTEDHCRCRWMRGRRTWDPMLLDAEEREPEKDLNMWLPRSPQVRWKDSFTSFLLCLHWSWEQCQSSKFHSYSKVNFLTLYKWAPPFKGLCLLHFCSTPHHGTFSTCYGIT